MIDEASNEGAAMGCTPPVLRDLLALPAGDVLLRKVAGPDGTNSWLGYVKAGRVYCCGARHALPLIDGGEFEVLPDWQTAVDAERAKLAEIAAAE